MPSRPTRSISRISASVWRVACSVCDRITKSNEPSSKSDRPDSRSFWITFMPFDRKSGGWGKGVEFRGVLFRSLGVARGLQRLRQNHEVERTVLEIGQTGFQIVLDHVHAVRSEEHTSELQSH